MTRETPAQCRVCRNTFMTYRADAGASSARYCSGRCRDRAARARKKGRQAAAWPELRRLLAEAFNDTDELEKRQFCEALLDYLAASFPEE